jgi:lysozyme family protein
MDANYSRSLAAVLKHEGGYVDHPKDPGGATNLGITIGTLSDWIGRRATKAEVKALTVGKVAPIYRQKYWDVVKAGEMPAGLDYALFDFAVNSGPAKAAITLQTILGVASDGKIGPLTLAAVAKHNPSTLINELCSHRLAFLERLSTWPTFGKGWASRVNGVRALALEMAKDATPAPSKPIPVSPLPPPAPSLWERFITALQGLFSRKD